MALVFHHLATVAYAHGEHNRAAHLLAVAARLRETGGGVTPYTLTVPADYERAVAAVQAALGAKAFAVCWAEGLALTGEQAIDIALTRRASPAAPIASAQSAALLSPSYPAGLTAREVEILRLLAQGLTYAQIADHLVITRRTVNAHLTTIYDKLGVHSRAAATRFAVEHHLV
jgi:DNA-binding NarL/FixJ family response regulator